MQKHDLVILYFVIVICISAFVVSILFCLVGERDSFKRLGFETAQQRPCG